MVQAILSNSEEDKIVAGLTKLITNKGPTCRSIVILELLISWWSKLFLVMVKECLLVYIKIHSQPCFYCEWFMFLERIDYICII